MSSLNALMRAGYRARVRAVIADYPGTTIESADLLAQAVVDLDASTMPGLVDSLLDWVQTYQQEREWEREQ